MSTRQRVLFFDIETAPMLAYVWRAKTDWVPHNAFTHETFMLTWAAKFRGEKRVHHARLTSAEAQEQNDTRIVLKLADLIRTADVIVAHNGDRFDLPKLNGRLLLNRMEPLGPVNTIDTLKLAKRHFQLASNKLDYLGQVLGISKKVDTDFELWERAYRGEASALKEMDLYCRHDVVGLLEPVFEALYPYVKLPRLADASEAWEHICPVCGSDNLVRQGYYRTNASTFQRFRCKDCGKWSRGRREQQPFKVATVPLG